jgi:2'-5' RNA ligase
MLAIASLVSLNQNPESKAIWDSIEDRCDDFGYTKIQIPHFSWQIATDYALHSMIPALSALASTWKEFTINTTGLGLFTGNIPALYLPIIKTQDLLEKHIEIWDLCSSFGTEVSPMYAPENWLPHITLVHQGFSLENVTCIIGDLFLQKLSLQFLVKKIEIIYQDNEKEGVTAEIALQKG